MDKSGNIYGSNTVGGPHCNSDSYCGAIYKLSPGGTYSALYGFTYDSQPEGSLHMDSSGNLYGASAGGQDGAGFNWKLSGTTLTVLHIFCSSKNCTDGGNPTGSLIADKDGQFLGLAGIGGIGEYPTGVVYLSNP
jgi:hypothetical protein